MRIFAYVAVGLIATVLTGQAAMFRFDSDPFAGSTAPATPGRQVVGNESFISFSTASDVFSLDPTVFGITDPVLFANDVIGSIPASNVNVVVLRTFDNDNNAATPFGAGNAANLIAEQITTPGAGFFIYFNSGLDLARLVYSTDLSDPTADLKILARLTNLTGQGGRDALPSFTSANFEITAVPEPSSLALMVAGGLGIAVCRLRNRFRR